MFRSLYTAASGMEAQELSLDNIANNLANANTSGFRRRRLQFGEVVAPVLLLGQRHGGHRVGDVLHQAARDRAAVVVAQVAADARRAEFGILARDHLGELRGGTVDIRRIDFPRGLSTLQLSVRPKESNPSKGPSIPILAQLDGVELSQIDLHPGG